MDVTESEYEIATQRGKLLRQTIPSATSARYDSTTGRLIVGLSSGVELSIPLSLIRALDTALPSALAEIELNAGGYGIRFPRIDEDIYVPALLVDFCGAPKEVA